MAIDSLILPLHHAARTDHRTIPAKIFVENLNCPDLTASFLAGAKDLWRIQKTACLLLSAIALPGSSGQFPEWLTFDVSDPKVLRGVLEGDSSRLQETCCLLHGGSLGRSPAQPKMHFVFGQDTSGPLEFSLVLHLGTTPWVMAHDFVPGLWGLLLDTRPTSFDLGHYLCSKGILNASLEALLGLSLAFLAGYYSSPLLITATGHQEGHLLLRGCLNPRTLGHLLAAQGVLAWHTSETLPAL